MSRNLKSTKYSTPCTTSKCKVFGHKIKNSITFLFTHSHTLRRGTSLLDEISHGLDVLGSRRNIIRRDGSIEPLGEECTCDMYM